MRRGSAPAAAGGPAPLHRDGILFCTSPRRPLRLALTLGVTGRYGIQAGSARAGLEVAARQLGVDLVIVDDHGDPAVVEETYRRFVDEGVDLVLGPYGSDLSRRAAAVVCPSGRLLWNHGGAADDVARPLVATAVAPASTYLDEPAAVASGRGMTELILVCGAGRFPAAVATGARRRCRGLGLPCRLLPLEEWDPSTTSEHVAVFFVASFAEELRAVRQLRASGQPVGLVGSVAAGIDAFGAHLGSLAEGVIGPAQWYPDHRVPAVGDSGTQFAASYRKAAGSRPDYVAAQAAATLWLAVEARRNELAPETIREWRTSTLLGPFALDRWWRQVGYTAVGVAWQTGQRRRLR